MPSAFFRRVTLTLIAQESPEYGEQKGAEATARFVSPAQGGLFHQADKEGLGEIMGLFHGSHTTANDQMHRLPVALAKGFQLGK